MKISDIKKMTAFESASILILTVQTIILLFAGCAAWYFGASQKDINERLSNIEKYRYEQEQKVEFSKNLKEKKQLRKLILEIFDSYTWGAGTPKEIEIKTRTYKDKINITKKIQKLLDQGFNIPILKNNKKALINWFKAYNMTEGILDGQPLDEGQKKYIDGAFNDIDGYVSEVYSNLKLSYHHIRRGIEKELKNSSKNTKK
ncbi:hypothetical protein ACFL4O_01565 [bacterium]